ncbi:MAG: NTP transferase domain-containing protein [Microcella sp.]|uniref:NTP transferase domain-containing protein n=1 Tax=Microcella sp. TaxID=1913979 RepID=UPI0024CCFB70|nr:NTP transferase domain-containing protein [Microcella sp.]UYN83820.1 MAG: NTP transferase domain-containing protein [Microcella sp.]
MAALVSLVIPVRPAATAKSRLAVDRSAEAHSRRAALAAAIALDTVEAARASLSVGEVFVVGSLAEPVAGVQLVDEPGLGLLVAIAEGLARCDAAAPTAVLLGDLPALQPADLDAALLGASEHHWSFVADADGAGTTLVVAQAGLPHSLRFGVGSAEQHSLAGYAELDVPVTSGLRRDVDTLEQLDELTRLAREAVVRLGPRTSALVQ